VRAAIYAKGLEIPIESPPGGLKSDGYRAISLTGTIPCLILDDGSPLPESAVIIDYLDDKFPARPLAPANPEAKARMKLIQRIAEADLVGPMVQLYHDLAAGDGEAGKARTLARFERGLGLIEALIADAGYVAGPELSTADCIFAPALLGVVFWSPALGRPTLLADHPRIAAYTSRAHAHPAIARVLDELRAALARSPIAVG
jgi:glutathione S-transferase